MANNNIMFKWTKTKIYNAELFWLLFCTVEGAAEVIGVVGGVQDVLAAMRAFPNNAELFWL